MKRQLLSLFILFAALVSFVPSSRAQVNIGAQSEGTDFYLGYVEPSMNTVIPAHTYVFYRAYLLISSFNENTVQIYYHDPNTGQELPGKSVLIPKRQSVAVDLDQQACRLEDQVGDRKAEFRAIRVVARKGPINVQFFNSGASACGSYLAFPVSSLGKNYVIQSFYDNPDGNLGLPGGRGPSQIEKAAGFFMIVAPYDATSVEITPMSTTQGGAHPGKQFGPGSNLSPQPYMVALKKGQCYLVKSGNFSDAHDITSSTVRSDKPIFVIAGHEDAGIGSVNSKNMEGRDYMVESMIPTEYWDNTGYVMAPFVDSSPAVDEGVGELFRVVTEDPGGAQVTQKASDKQGTRTFSVGYLAEAPVLNEITGAQHYFSTNGAKFAVMGYDQRNHSTQQPFPAPSMVSVVPISRWRNAYLWYVPANTAGERLQGYYANVLGPRGLNGRKMLDSVRVSKNGETPRSLAQAWVPRGTFNTIPDHPELMGARYQLSPGSYYANATFPFMVYHYGNRAVDYDGDLGDFDNDDNFFSYALPVGMVLSTGEPPQLSITVDTSCSKWRVCVTDHRPNGGIKSAALLNDPEGDVLPTPDSLRKIGILGYKYVNTYLDPLLDPLGTREIAWQGKDSTVCFDVLVSNVGQDGYAPLLMIDNAGNGIMIELRYKQASVAYSPNPDSVIDLGIHKIGDGNSATFTFYNLPSSNRAYLVTRASLKTSAPGFTLDSTVPAIPYSVGPGDSLKAFFSFVATDTATYEDSLVLETDCFTQVVPLRGGGGTPLILASDLDFGTVVLGGGKKCMDAVVENVGKMPFTLTVDYLLKDPVHFELDPTTIAQLPKVLQPKEKFTVRFCYNPQAVETNESETIWGSDIAPPFTHSIDDTTKLIGRAVEPGVDWDRLTQEMFVLCDSYDTVRVNLVNTQTASQDVDKIEFTGADFDEFTILNTEIGRTTNFTVDPGDTIWVDVQFHADLSKTPTYRLRNAALTAFYRNVVDSQMTKDIIFTGYVRRGEITLQPDVTVELGYVTPGQPNTFSIVIRNTGDSTLYIDRADIPAEFTNFDPPLNFPMTLQPNDANFYLADFTLGDYIDTTVTLTFYSPSVCSDPKSIIVHASASMKDVIPFSFTSPNVYVNCRTNEGPVGIINRGTIPIKLRSVEIVNRGADDDADQFTFNVNGTRRIDFVPADTLPAGQRFEFPVTFAPTRELGLRAAVVYIFEYDTAGPGTTVIDSVIGFVEGTGVLLHNIFSVKNQAGVPYSEETGAIFRLPVRITDNIEQQAGVFGMSFTLVFREDLFEFGQIDAGPYGFTVDGSPTPVPDGNGNVTLNITLRSTSGQIETGRQLCDIVFRVMVARDETSDFDISNGVFLDNNGQSLCYFENQHLPDVFEPRLLCGDPSLREFLNGNTTFSSIAPVTPNPVTTNASPKVVYSVAQDNTPVAVELYDALGNKISTLLNVNAAIRGEHSVMIPTKFIQTSGTYTVRIVTPDGVKNTSFVVTK